MLDRRQMFIGGAAALAPTLALSQSATPSFVSASEALAAALAAARNDEDPRLVQIGDDLPGARDRLQRSLDRLWDAQDAAVAAAPRIPDGLAVPFGISVFGSLGWYTLGEPANILGDPIELPRHVNPKSGKELPVRVPTTADIIKDRQSGRRINGGHLPAWHKGEHRRLYDLARGHEGALEATREKSGLSAAEDERAAAEIAVLELCQRARPIQAKTILGLLIKAETMEACEDVSGSVSDDLIRLGAALLPGEVTRILGGQA